MAATKCRICDRAIGYRRGFYDEGAVPAGAPAPNHDVWRNSYNDTWHPLVHADCLEDQIEAQRRKA